MDIEPTPVNNARNNKNNNKQSAAAAAALFFYNSFGPMGETDTVLCSAMTVSRWTAVADGV